MSILVKSVQVYYSLYLKMETEPCHCSSTLELWFSPNHFLKVTMFFLALGPEGRQCKTRVSIASPGKDIYKTQSPGGATLKPYCVAPSGTYSFTYYLPGLAKAHPGLTYVCPPGLLGWQTQIVYI